MSISRLLALVVAVYALAVASPASAVDAADERHAEALGACLPEQERAGRLMYETGRS